MQSDPLGLVGTLVSDKYEIERVVGEGGFAVVYRAIHKVWQRPVAIKVFRTFGHLPPEHREQLVKSFIQEGALLAELSERSAAICQARDVGMLETSDGREMPYMVLEWLEGCTLEQVLIDERVAGLSARTPSETLNLLEPAALALALAHKKGIAHRDVKPANIFVLGEPRGDFAIKLLDFGIAKVVQDIQREAGAFLQTQGVVSSFTPSYGAPEQFSRRHGATGPWTDVFALALIFTEIMTQELPLRGDDLTQLAICSMDEKRRPTPRTYGFDISDALEAALRRALAVAPADRFPSTGEFWQALRSALAMEPARAFASTDPTRPDAAPSSGLQVTALAVHDTILMPADLGSGARLSLPAELDGVPKSALAEASAPLVTNPTSGRSTLSLFAGLGAGVVALAGVVAAAVYMLAIKGKDVVAPVVASSAPAVASSAPAVAAPRAACPSGMTMVSGGKFFMGSDDAKDEPRERPAHQVTLPPYCIDTTEVTVSQYKRCSDKGECKRAPRENDWPHISAHEHKIYDPLCTIRDPDVKAEHPINCVDWALSDAFCKASGKRLPTEAEWEFATRSSDGRKYPWGDDPPTSEHLNACGRECVAWGKRNNEDVAPMYAADDNWPTTAPVGSFPKGASPFGLQDVVGNVWEWASDWYAPYDAPGAAAGTERVLRGGAWNGGDQAWVRPTYRFKSPPSLRSHGIGFRCAKTLE